MYEWVQAENGEFPPNAVKVGYDSGNVVYVARAKHMGDNIPGKFLPVYGLCYVPWGGREHEYDEYEVTMVSWFLHFLEIFQHSVTIIFQERKFIDLFRNNCILYSYVRHRQAGKDPLSYLFACQIFSLHPC